MVVFDTDHLSLFEGARGIEADRLRARLEHISPEEWATTIITYEEQTRGWLAYVGRARTLVQQIDAYRKLNRHLDVYRSIRVLEFDERAATQLQHLRKGGVRISPMDLKIAAIVLGHDATLLSRNLKDFHKVPGLKVEDWTV